MGKIKENRYKQTDYTECKIIFVPSTQTHDIKYIRDIKLFHKINENNRKKPSKSTPSKL